MTHSEAAPAPVVAPEDTRTGRGAWLVLVAVLPGMFMNVFDFFAVNVATPALHRDLGSSPPALELIVGGYGLTFSLGLVTGGRLGDRYGRRRVFFAASINSGVTASAGGAACTEAAKGLAAGKEPPALAGNFTVIRGAEKILEPGENWRTLGTQDDPVVRESSTATTGVQVTDMVD